MNAYLAESGESERAAGAAESHQGNGLEGRHLPYIKTHTYIHTYINIYK
jgi:hypothetical protein